MKYYNISTCMVTLWFIVMVTLSFDRLTVAVKLPPNVSVPAVFGFGDSIIDPGNNNNIKTIVKCNFLPYGKDFMGGIPTGRFSNGRIPTDFVAEEVSVKKYVAAYSDPNLSPRDIATGVSFASGAAGYDPLTSQIASAIPLTKQLEQFKEYKGKLKSVVGEEKAESIISDGLYLVVAGSDDIANTYFDTPFRRLHYDIYSYTDLMLNSASSFVQELYKQGGRRMAVFGAPPIGCVPSQRTLGGGILRPCAENYNQVAQLFNSKLSIEINNLRRNLPNSRVVYINIYDPLLDFIQNPLDYGFEQVEKGCCGTGIIEVSVLCNKLDPICLDVSKYLFWDSYHPTQRGYQLLVTKLINKYITDLI